MKQYFANAFTAADCEGNPAAVCIMEKWLPEAVMQKIACKNGLSETAFCVKEEGGYRLRWFTPGGEIDLCGHATLASAYVLFEHFEPKSEKICFATLSGELTVVKRDDGLLEMDFPAYELKRVPVTDEMEAALGARPQEAYLGRDLLCVLKDEAAVIGLRPNMAKAARLPGLLQHMTAQGETVDCVSRSFAPKLKVDEDPVCGSGHCHIAPYWAEKLGKKDIMALQASERKGMLYCKCQDGRVYLAGQVTIYSIGELSIESCDLL